MKSPWLQIISPFAPPAPAPAGETLRRCVQLARRHGMEMLFYSRLSKHYAGAPDVDDYLQRKKDAFLRTVAQSVRQEAAAKNLLKILFDEGIPACVIKGYEIANSLYHDPCCRSSTDLDLLVRVKDLPAADQRLRENGFVPQDTLPLPFLIDRSHHRVYAHPPKGLILELHWNVGPPFYFDFTPEDLWKGISGNFQDGFSLTPQTQMILLLAHHFRHAYRELKLLTDILWGLYRFDTIIDWHDFFQTLQKFGMSKTALVTLRQLEDLWSNQVTRLISYTTLREKIRSAHLPSPLLRYFKMNPDEERSETLAARQMAKLTLDRKSRILYAFAKIFFPRPQEIRAFYPPSGAWMLPMNYLRFFFWRLRQLR